MSSSEQLGATPARAWVGWASTVRRLLLVAAVLPALVVTACAPSVAPGAAPQGSAAPGSAAPGSGAPGFSAPPAGSGGAPQPSPVSFPSDFPVNASPRLIVLTGPNIVDPSTGFVTDDQKMAYMNGNFALAAPLPTTTAATDGRRLLSAAAALAILRSNRSNGQQTHR